MNRLKNELWWLKRAPVGIIIAAFIGVISIVRGSRKVRG